MIKTMKTNQIMVRKMGDFKVEQRTKDGFFNATSLLKQWNESNPTKERNIAKFWELTHLPELMNEIAKNELGFTSPNFGDVKNALSRTSKARLDRGGGTWMHPILFIKFAMYLNPAFEYQVIKFVSDEMIAYRNDAGDAYKELSSALMRITDKSEFPKTMSIVAKGLNYIVFNEHSHEQRNQHGNVEQMRELLYLERHLTDLIKDGMITNYAALIGYMRKRWQNKYCPKFLR